MRLLTSLLGGIILAWTAARAQPASIPLPHRDAEVSFGLLETADQLCEKKDYVGALKKLEDAFLFLPNNVRLSLEKASLATARGDPSEAREWLQRANQGFEALPVIYGLSGRIRRKAGDYYGAIEAYTFALTLSPHYFPALAGRAAAREEIDDFEGAFADYETHITSGYRQGLEQVYFRRGMLYLKLQHRERAERDFRSAIEVNPRYSSPHGYLGSVLHDQGKLEEALAACNKAIELSPGDFRPYNTRLWIYYEMSKADQALEDAAKCIELMPENGNFVLFRALLLELLGDPSNATKDFMRVIELAERNRDHDLWFYASSYRFLLQRTRAEPVQATYLDDVLSWPDSWSKRLGLFLAGVTSVETLLSDARQAKHPFTRQQQQCEADYFIGMQNLYRGDLTGAKLHLERCRKMPIRMIETSLAEFALEKMEKP